MKRRLTALFLCCLVCLGLLSGCGGGNSGALNVSLPGSADNLDPLYSSSLFSDTVVMNCLEGLLVLQQDGSLANGCAESYTVSDDGLQYTFTLKEGLTWSDGTPLTADDFVFTFERMFQSSYPSDLASQYTCIQNASAVLAGTADVSSLGVRAQDSRTLVFTLESRNILFPNLLAGKGALPCNRQFFLDSAGKYGLSRDTLLFNGPFRITYMADGSVTLRRNDAYAGKDSVLPTVIYLSVADGEAAQSALNSGQADVAVLPGSLAEGVSAGDAETVYAGTTVYAIVFNRGNDYFRSANLRSALLYGLNRASLERGATSLIPGSVSVGGTPYASLLSGAPFPGYNADTAKQLYSAALSELGLVKIPSLTLLVPQDSGAQEALAPALQNWQRDLSFYINLKTGTTADITAAIQSGQYDAALIPLTADYDSPLAVLGQFLSSSPSNIYGYQNAAYDRLLSSVSSLSSEQAQADVFFQAEQLLAADSVLVPVYEEQTALVCMPGISGLSYPKGLGWLSFKSAVKQ